MINEELLKLEQEYTELFDKNNLFIFPDNWFNIEDKDELKIKVLKQAIKEKKLIINVDGGSEFLEKI